jgi:hypothetical protein
MQRLHKKRAKHLLKYTSSLAISLALLLQTQGCASAGRRDVAVENCVIPPPYVDKDGALRVDGAECTGADGIQVTKPFILMPRYVCQPYEDYFKVLEAQRR